jgi:hypothetical protein
MHYLNKPFGRQRNSDKILHLVVIDACERREPSVNRKTNLLSSLSRKEI